MCDHFNFISFLAGLLHTQKCCTNEVFSSPASRSPILQTAECQLQGPKGLKQTPGDPGTGHPSSFHAPSILETPSAAETPMSPLHHQRSGCHCWQVITGTAVCKSFPAFCSAATHSRDDQTQTHLLCLHTGALSAAG